MFARAISSVSLALALSTVSACSTSLVVSDDPSNLSSNETISGIPYRLPVREYSIKITRSLEACGESAYVVEPSAQHIRSGMTIKIAAEITSAVQPGETLTVAYLASAAWNKTSKVEVKTFDSGILKSINATATDKSPEIISSVISSGFKLARIAAGVPVATENVPEDATKVEFCSPYAKALLERRKQAEGAIEAKTEALEASQKELEGLKLVALVGGLTEKQKARVAEISNEIDRVTKQLKVAQELLKSFESKTSNTIEIIFTPTQVDIGKGKPIAITPTSAWKWLKPLVTSCASELIDGDEAKIACGSTVKGKHWAEAWGHWVHADLDVMAVLIALDNQQSSTVTSQLRKMVVSDRTSYKLNPGVLFRQPVRARLKLCNLPDVAACKESAEPIAFNDALVPQMGAWRSLPLRNGFGQDNELSATFLEDGVLTEAKYEEKSAPGEKAATMIDGVISQYGSYVEARRAKGKADATEAEAKAEKQETADLDKEIRRLTKAQKVLELQTTIDTATTGRKPPELIQLEAELAILRAQKEKKELLMAINKSE